MENSESWEIEGEANIEIQEESRTSRGNEIQKESSTLENSASWEIQGEANIEIQEESCTSRGNEIQKESSTSVASMGSSTSVESISSRGNEQLVDAIDAKLKYSEFSVRVPNESCRIYKVPYHLRKWNKAAYTPRVISIGPYHHNKEEFQTTERHKVTYLRHFMRRCERNLDDLVCTIRKLEDSIKFCYVESVQLKSNDFVEMILFDVIFILELFLKSQQREQATDDPRNVGNCLNSLDDPMNVENWLYTLVVHELLLLENQVPFFVIEQLYLLALPSLSKSLSLIQLTFNFFKHLNVHEKAPEGEIQHFTDLLRFFELPSVKELPVRHHEVIYPKYSLTQLREAGVEFEVVSSNRVLGLNFNKGVLKIPLLAFEDNMEARVRNIMALEQCDPRKLLYFTDFILILDRLVNTNTDVDLLSDKGIVVNSLGDNNVVTSIINNLNRGIFRGDMNRNYCDLCKALNAFYEERWHRWKALLRHQYFSSPWRSASTIAAIILLVLTLIQTILSIIK